MLEYFPGAAEILEPSFLKLRSMHTPRLLPDFITSFPDLLSEFVEGTLVPVLLLNDGNGELDIGKLKAPTGSL